MIMSLELMKSFSFDLNKTDYESRFLNEYYILKTEIYKQL